MGTYFIFASIFVLIVILINERRKFWDECLKIFKNF